eukprot:12762816-Ditylum_brightwellii.AAC.1
MSKKQIFVLLVKTSPGISDVIKKKLSDHRDGTSGNEDMGNSKSKDTETEEENDSATPRITKHWRAAAVAAMATIVEELMGPEPPNQDDADGDLNFVPSPDDASNATEEGDDDFSLGSDEKEDLEKEADEYVPDEDPNHLSHT